MPDGFHRPSVPIPGRLLGAWAGGSGVDASPVPGLRLPLLRDTAVAVDVFPPQHGPRGVAYPGTEGLRGASRVSTGPDHLATDRGDARQRMFERRDGPASGAQTQPASAESRPGSGSPSALSPHARDGAFCRDLVRRRGLSLRLHLAWATGPRRWCETTKGIVLVRGRAKVLAP
ncbi:hypothetical protein CDD83_3319 [Cordyceps sp. RAO-2017]|nr:hypothetical protein CDD83_3319 [Cordyceps sp. RAO-2017]